MDEGNLKEQKGLKELIIFIVLIMLAISVIFIIANSSGDKDCLNIEVKNNSNVEAEIQLTIDGNPRGTDYIGGWDRDTYCYDNILSGENHEIRIVWRVNDQIVESNTYFTKDDIRITLHQDGTMSYIKF